MIIRISLGLASIKKVPNIQTNHEEVEREEKRGDVVRLIY